MAIETESLRAGDPWLGLTQELIPLVRADVVLRVLHGVNTLSPAAMVEWTQAVTPTAYVPGGFDGDDAEFIALLRPVDGLLLLVAFPQLDIARISDLVYAGAAEIAATPEALLVEDVYELSVANEKAGAAANTATLRVSIPSPGPHARLDVQSAHVTVEGKLQIAELQPEVRQRKMEDTWAEIALPERTQLWYMAVANALVAKATQTSTLLLFPRVGDKFLTQPVLKLNSKAPGLINPPVSRLATHHKFFSFPEIDGEVFMLRLGTPPATATDNDPGPPVPGIGWPQAFTFHAGTGDILLYAPSYPSEVDVRFGDDPAWTRSGELAEAARSPDVSDALQAALDRLPDDAGPAGRELAITAATRTPGTLHLGVDADLHVIVDTFADRTRTRELAFTAERQQAEVPLSLPPIGAPHEAGVAVELNMTTSVIVSEVAAEDAPTGADRIGMRVIGDAAYTQSFTVDAAFSLTAIDLRVAQTTGGATLRLAIHAGEASATVQHRLGTGREARWLTVKVEPALPLEPETTYAIVVSAVEGAFTWLCGAGDDIHHLQRQQGVAPPREVQDVAGQAPLSGRLRLRTERPVHDPQLTVALVPGDHAIPLQDVKLLEDGRIRARLDLVGALTDQSVAEVALRLRSRSEGTVTLERPSITYRLQIQATR